MLFAEIQSYESLYIKISFSLRQSTMLSSQKTLRKTMVVKLLISYAFVKNILCWKVLIPKVFETLASLSVWILVEITKPGSISAKNLLYCREIIQRSSLMSVKWGLFMTSVFAWARHVELVACVTTAMPSFTELGEKPVKTVWKLCKCPQISNVLQQPTGYEKTRDACIIIRSDLAYAYV